MGKGSKQRPTDTKTYVSNFDEIHWGNKKEGKKLPNGKTRFVYGEQTSKIDWDAVEALVSDAIDDMNEATGQLAMDDVSKAIDGDMIKAISGANATEIFSHPQLDSNKDL